MTPDIDLSRAVWHKSTRSNNGGACVDVATNLPAVVAVRDSKDPGGPALLLTHRQWRRFVDSIRSEL
jgi:hypothetical protein